LPADNARLDGGDREDTVLRLHVRRGNNRSEWIAEGSYDGA